MPGTESAPRPCDVCRERTSHAQVHLHCLPGWKTFCGSNHHMIAFTDGSLLRRSRRICYVRHHNPICSRGLHAVSQYINGGISHSCKDSKMLLFTIDGGAHWICITVNLTCVDGFFQTLLTLACLHICFPSPSFHSKKMVPYIEQARARICTACVVRLSIAWKEYRLQQEG